MSEGTFYNWRAKFGGITVSEAKRLKSLDDENAKLKKLLAQQMLDLAAIKDLVSKSGRARREVRSRRISSGRAWPVGAAGLPHRRRGSHDDPLSISACTGRGSARPVAESGQRAPAIRLPAPVRAAAMRGRALGINRIYRLYRKEELTVRKRKARRRAVGTPTPILVEARPNARWSLDFVYDQFAGGQRFRVLDVVDDVTRECLAVIQDTSISGRRVALGLTALIERRRKPGIIVSDQGTELTSNAILRWCSEHRVE